MFLSFFFGFQVFVYVVYGELVLFWMVVSLYDEEFNFFYCIFGAMWIGLDVDVFVSLFI